jgi:hypothetical protein
MGIEPLALIPDNVICKSIYPVKRQIQDNLESQKSEHPGVQ